MKTSFLKKLQLLWALPSHYRGYLSRVNLSWHLPWLTDNYQKRLLQRWEAIPEAEADADLSALDCLVTAVPNIRAGIGHTLSEYIAGRIWARKTGARYAHCAMAEPWEAMLHFAGEGPSLTELKKRGVRCYKMPRLPSHPDELDFDSIRRKWVTLTRRGPVCIILGDGQNAYDQAYASKELRELYKAAPDYGQRLNLRVDGKINVSVHVRRRNKADMLNPSVHDENSAAYKARYLEGDYFLQLCRIIEQALGPDRVHFNLFSQGEEDAFAEFKELADIRFCLDTDQYETFHNLTLSDILIVSPSSFSFKAGMLCDGLKLAKYPWWHEIPEDEEWVRIGDTPDAEKDRLLQRIREQFKDLDARFG